MNISKVSVWVRLANIDKISDISIVKCSIQVSEWIGIILLFSVVLHLQLSMPVPLFFKHISLTDEPVIYLWGLGFSLFNLFKQGLCLWGLLLPII